MRNWTFANSSLPCTCHVQSLTLREMVLQGPAITFKSYYYWNWMEQFWRKLSKWNGSVLFLLFHHLMSVCSDFLNGVWECWFFLQSTFSEFNGVSDTLNGLIDLSGNVLGLLCRPQYIRYWYWSTRLSTCEIITWKHEKYPFAELLESLIHSGTNYCSKNAVTLIGKFKIQGWSDRFQVTGTLFKKTPKSELELEQALKCCFRPIKFLVPKLVFLIGRESRLSLSSNFKTQKIEWIELYSLVPFRIFRHFAFLHSWSEKPLLMQNHL